MHQVCCWWIDSTHSYQEKPQSFPTQGLSVKKREAHRQADKLAAYMETEGYCTFRSSCLIYTVPFRPVNNVNYLLIQILSFNPFFSVCEGSHSFMSSNCYTLPTTPSLLTHIRLSFLLSFCFLSPFLQSFKVRSGDGEQKRTNSKGVSALFVI